jgi:D-3-phosphoglycerate dehydrogenase
MTIDNKPLVLDLVEWIAGEARPYADVMDAWRTSCPRLPVWEDAVDLGFVVRVYREGSGAMVEATDAGRAFLASERPATARSS